MRPTRTPSVLLAVVIVAAAVLLLALPVSGGAAASRSAAGPATIGTESQEPRSSQAPSDFCGRISTRNCAKVLLRAQKVRTPTNFLLAVHLESEEKLPVELSVAFPRGMAFARRGVGCSNEHKEAGICPRDARLGKVWGEWDVVISDFSFPCIAHALAPLKVFNASSWLGYVIGGYFNVECLPCQPGSCVLYLTNRFQENVLRIILPNWEQRLEQQAPHLAPFRATMSDFFMGAQGKTTAGVPLLRTPRGCDRERGWKSVVKLTFDDGSTKRFTSRHRCHR
jgi:hypothetical protein